MFSPPAAGRTGPLKSRLSEHSPSTLATALRLDLPVIRAAIQAAHSAAVGGAAASCGSGGAAGAGGGSGSAAAGKKRQAQGPHAPAAVGQEGGTGGGGGGARRRRACDAGACTLHHACSANLHALKFMRFPCARKGKQGRWRLGAPKSCRPAPAVEPARRARRRPGGAYSTAAGTDTDTAAALAARFSPVGSSMPAQAERGRAKRRA